MSYYKPEILVDVNEMSMENLMRGPVVEVSDDQRLLYGKRKFRANKAGYTKYWPLIATHECDAVSIASDDIAENNYFEEFDIDLSQIDVTGITSLELGGLTRFPANFDWTSLLRMTAVRQLVTDHLSFRPDLTSYFPHLEAFLNFNWKTNRVRNLGKAWPHLKYLHIQGFNDSLTLFQGRDLRRIFLINPSLKSLDELKLFPNLDTLFISGLRKGVDVSVIAELPSLKRLGFLGAAKNSGWEGFRSETVEILDLGWAPTESTFDHFPALKHGNISKMPGSSYGASRNWDTERFEYPFSLVVPTQLIL
jgi:hypothetical protein